MDINLYISDEHIKKEKYKARNLRQSQWWKRRLAKGICHYCKKKIPVNQLTMDHIIPISRGGKTTKSNVVTACKECNNHKKNNLPIELII